MTDEFALNLLFSATYEPMHHSVEPPPREVRIAHNHARRLLSERYGFEEWQKLVQEVHVRTFLRRPTILSMMLSAAVVGVAYWWMKKAPAR